MPLVVVASAKGSPGVTTLTVALAALTAGAVAADLDPDGGDLALRYRAADGAPLDPDTGLLSLAASIRRDTYGTADEGGPDPVEAHLQVAAGGLDMLLGVTTPDQAIGLGPLWSPLGRALAESPRPIFADCGRVGPSSPTMPVLVQADAVILLARAELEELAHLRERLRFLTAAMAAGPARPHRLGVILVAGDRDRAAAPRTAQLLRSSGLTATVLGTVADDLRGAARLRGLRGGQAGRTTLVRSVRSLLPSVAQLAGMVPSAPPRATETGAPAAEAAAVEAPGVRAAAVEAPAVPAPMVRAPLAEAPAVEAPAVEAPATEAPDGEAPVVEAPGLEAPVTEAPDGEASIGEADVVGAAATEAEVPQAAVVGAAPSAGPADLDTLPDGGGPGGGFRRPPSNPILEPDPSEPTAPRSAAPGSTGGEELPTPGAAALRELAGRGGDDGPARSPYRPYEPPAEETPAEPPGDPVDQAGDEAGPDPDPDGRTTGNGWPGAGSALRPTGGGTGTGTAVRDRRRR